MTEAPLSPTPPVWVYKRDGRLVPFEADKISRALFAATESLGEPDVFLARELTDGIVHFLTTEVEGPTPTTEQIAELVIKVTRELGRPALAQAFADFAAQRLIQDKHRGKNETVDRIEQTPEEREIRVDFTPGDSLAAILQRCTRRYTLQTVFTRDLAAAYHDGLIGLTELETPLELAGCLLEDPTVREGSLIEFMHEMRQHTGKNIYIDGPEYTLLRRPGNMVDAVTGYIHELEFGLRTTGLCAILNSGCVLPPAWAGELAEGPLFVERKIDTDPQRLATLCHTLLESMLRGGLTAGIWRFDWHLNATAFSEKGRESLVHLVRLAIEGAPLTFVFDRPKQSVALGEGVDRRHSALLFAVGLHLPRLIDQPNLRKDPSLFLQKMGSLARLALSAAVQKREFLRRQSQERPALARRFLLDRTRLLVVPVGLEYVVRTLTGQEIISRGSGLELARRIIQRLREVLDQEGRSRLLESCIDVPSDYTLAPVWQDDSSRGIVGLSPWDVTMSARNPLRLVGSLHTATTMGTADLLITEEQPPTSEQVVDWLQGAWQQTELIRIRLIRPILKHRQLTFPDTESPR